MAMGPAALFFVNQARAMQSQTFTSLGYYEYFLDVGLIVGLWTNERKVNSACPEFFALGNSTAHPS
jgi:hypothetical protein